MRPDTAEDRRLAARADEPWMRWGPYLSERQWGTVREDYSADGDAWDAFPHDHARSRAYRWGEDGIAGLSDDRGRLCLALSLWNGADPILKERLFGLTNGEGNHGEDVKEVYHYRDSTPTHSHMRHLYRYPQRAFPYAELVEENARRRGDPDAFEHELIDTGAFDGDRYFDVETTVAKRGPEDILVRITATNRGPEPAPIWLLPTLWFRNTWSWGQGARRPSLWAPDGAGHRVTAEHHEMGRMRLIAPDADDLWFCDNETNAARLHGTAGPAFPKDGIGDRLIHGAATTNPERRGTKAAAVHHRVVGAGGTAVITLRLTADEDARDLGPDGVFEARAAEADAFYAARLGGVSQDRRAIARQAHAGLHWSKQFFHYVVADWLDGDAVPPPPGREHGRNAAWRHLHAEDVISMPDAWEYPWFAAWDLCFQAVALARTDPDFAKEQVLLLTREWYASPEGQVPAYEWNFADANPPLQAWAALRIARHEREATGRLDRDFLRRVFEHGLVSFTWWVNRKDAGGDNLFQGGFLGLDNVSAFDRSADRMPGGGRLYQADGTAWMGFFALAMMEIAVLLADEDAAYDEHAAKFLQHFVLIADALEHVGRESGGLASLWSEEAGLWFDVLRIGDRFVPVELRSLVSVLPIIAASPLDLDALEARGGAALRRRVEWLRARQRPMLEATSEAGGDGRLLMSFLPRERLARLLGPLLDEAEFLSPHGIRSLSRRHLDEPYRAEIAGERLEVAYRPAESGSGLFGGNSNWRGPVWMPMNLLIVDALRRQHAHHGPGLTVECPTGSGVRMTLDEVADEIARRLISTFERGPDGRRPVFGGAERHQTDPGWRDDVLFYEYFHGDDGAGLGASHQTGWTALVAVLIEEAAVPRQGA